MKLQKISMDTQMVEVQTKVRGMHTLDIYLTFDET